MIVEIVLATIRLRVAVAAGVTVASRISKCQSYVQVHTTLDRTVGRLELRALTSVEGDKKLDTIFVRIDHKGVDLVENVGLPIADAQSFQVVDSSVVTILFALADSRHKRTENLEAFMNSRYI